MTLPSGTITFLFTDIEGSTRLWEDHPQAMRQSLARHDALLRHAIADNNGVVFKTVGDAFCAAFATAPDALNAALQAQLALKEEFNHREHRGNGEHGEEQSTPVGTAQADAQAQSGSLSSMPAEPPSSAPVFPVPPVFPVVPIILRVRMALHTGAAELRDGDYFGQPLNRVARLLAIGHGGQTLLSDVAHDLVRDTLLPPVTLLSLGEHRLRDLSRPEPIFQLLHPDLPSEFAPLKSLSNSQLLNNLPRQMTSFIGREKEMEAVKSLLGKARLLTLTGSGGSGKTRLSLQAAADVLEAYPDGVWFVELAPLADPALVATTLAQTLGVTEEPGKPLAQTLVAALKARKMLIVLDNCEHLLDACARLLGTLLRACPGVQALASSREALGIAGEQTYRLPSLSLPDTRQAQTPASLTQYEAVRLFVERALAVQPAFAVTNHNAPSVAQLCVHLDGIPLAIELAAARVRSLSVEEINSKLDNRFRLLTGGSRTALPRQQTLRALIDWSYDLLTAQEKTLLRRLSVFAGGWTLEAAEQVGASENETEGGMGDSIEDWEMLDLLTSLADKSLVLAQAQNEITRYRLLETVRQYARDRLMESGEGIAVRARHGEYFLTLADDIDPKLQGPEQARWLDALEEEHDNLRQALTFYTEDAEDTEAGQKGLRLGAALQPFWMIRGYLGEGRERLAALLAHSGGQSPTKARAEALSGAGVLAWMQSDYDEAQILYAQSLNIRRQLGDRQGIATSLNNMGVLASCKGDYSQARELYEESLALRREAGDKFGVAASLTALGTTALDQGDYENARVFHQESLSIHRELGNNGGIALSLGNLGAVAQAQGDYENARVFQEESLRLSRALDDRGGIVLALYNIGVMAQIQRDYGAAWSALEEGLTITRDLGERRYAAYYLEAFASFFVHKAQKERGVCLWSASAALRESIGSPLPPTDLEKQENEKRVVEQSVGEAAFALAWTQGQVMTWEQAVTRALEGGVP